MNMKKPVANEGAGLLLLTFLGLTAHCKYYPGTVRACAVQTVKPKNALSK